jgi:hypothetical protein
VEYDAPQSVLHIKNAPQLQFLLAQFTINDGLKKKRVDVKKQKQRKNYFLHN